MMITNTALQILSGRFDTANTHLEAAAKIVRAHGGWSVARVGDNHKRNFFWYVCCCFAMYCPRRAPVFLHKTCMHFAFASGSPRAQHRDTIISCPAPQDLTAREYPRRYASNLGHNLP